MRSQESLLYLPRRLTSPKLLEITTLTVFATTAPACPRVDARIDLDVDEKQDMC